MMSVESPRIGLYEAEPLCREAWNPRHLWLGEVNKT